jgi:general secretion pathway protein B
MSYILDALKKAESERKLGSVPNVYMDPLPMAKSEEATLSLRKTWWWVAAALLATSGIAALWLKGSQPKVPASAPPIVATQAAVSPPVVRHQESATVAPVKRETPQLNSPSMKAEVRPPSLPAPKETVAESLEKPVGPVKRPVEESKRQLAKSSANGNPEKPLESSKVPVTLSQASTAPAPATERLPADVPVATLRDLPEHIQRSIPQISIGGYIYSAKPAERSMLLNNSLLREGEQLASGLTLETMMAKEAILNYQGQRFRMPYPSY